MSTTAEESYPQIPLDKIRTPGRSEKLHPVENEDEEDWERFKDSVGTEPDKPVLLARNGKMYDVLDGDRRIRAVEENGGDNVKAFIIDDTDLDFTERSIKMLRSNELRLPNDPEQRSWHIAQLVEPWLIRPGERRNNEPMTQVEAADKINVSQSTISKNWLPPQRDKRPLRHTLAELSSGHRPSKQELEEIDEIVSLLLQGERVIPPQQEGWAADELGSMTGPSLAEIKQAAKRAVDNNWTLQEFLEFIDENFARDQDAGPVGGGITKGGTFEDTSEEQTYDGDPESTGEAQPVEEEADEEDELSPIERIEVDWDKIVDDDDLVGDTTVEQVKNRQMTTKTFQGETAVAMYMLAEYRGTDIDSVIDSFVGPLIIDEVINTLEE